ncbi:MAG: hypothetical protein U0270_07035 [Labilithrix sp.]
MKRVAAATTVLGLAAACSSFDGDGSPPGVGPAPNDGGTTPEAAVGTDGGSSGSTTPRILATGLDHVSGLAIDDEAIYAGSDVKDGRVYRIEKSTGAVTPLFQGTNVRQPIVAGDSVYVGGDEGVFEIDKRKGAGEKLSDSPQTALAFDGKDLFGCHYAGPFTDQDLDRITGKTTSVVAKNIQGCESLAVIGGVVFFGASLSVSRVPATGGTTSIVGRYAARRVIVDGELVYTQAFFDGDIRRARVDADGGASDKVSTTPEGAANGLGDLTLDATHVYWTAGSDKGGVFRAPKALGAIPEVLASGVAYASAIVVDDHAIYWTEAGRGLLWTRAK